MNKDKLRNLPAVDKLLQYQESKTLVNEFGRSNVVNVLRQALSKERESIQQGNEAKSVEEIIAGCRSILKKKFSSSLKPVLNGSGIILHTNLGRAPLGDKIMTELKETAGSYCNVEFDLEKGRRGQRNDHIRSLLQEVTGAEDAVVVNNNAASVFLILQTLAKGKEVIISRGELIEIGGSFRIPDIMASSGAIMREVGCTNRTHLRDYEAAINENTGLIFKAHKSNYFLQGFTEEVEIKELAELAKKHNLPFIYDIGSGLLRKPDSLPLVDEPDVRTVLQQGADVVCFSGDKLLGGSQAGVIAGKSELVQKFALSPLMRVLRVGKLSLTVLQSVMKMYLKDESLQEFLPLFQFLSRENGVKKQLAESLQAELQKIGINSIVEDSMGRCGGGTLPALKIESYALKLDLALSQLSASEFYYRLLKSEKPVLGIVREGDFYIDILCLSESEIPVLIQTLQDVLP